MSNTWLVILIAGIGGVAVTLQAQFMGTMDRIMGTRESVFVTYGGGGLLITLLMLFVWRGGNLAEWRSVPPYALFAGVFGLIIVASIGYATSRLGLIAAFGVILASQYISGALIDHFGLLGATVRPLDFGRLLGMAVLVLGAWLVVR
jgi:transporter family-2 protein